MDAECPSIRNEGIIQDLYILIPAPPSKVARGMCIPSRPDVSDLFLVILKSQFLRNKVRMCYSSSSEPGGIHMEV
jgi:hypothetical protein